MQKIIALAFTVVSFFPAGPVFALSDLTTVCSGGIYDYCSQAPKCGEYPEWNAAWEQRSRDLWNKFSEVFQFCQYKACQGYVPLCCYEMVRTGDKDKCAGYDTNYCLPTQCKKVPGSESKNCGISTTTWNESTCDIRNLLPIPLSQRFPNDVLFILIDQNPNSPLVRSLPTTYPDIWNKYQQWKGTPTTPPAAPTTPQIPGQPTVPAKQPTAPPGNLLPPPYVPPMQLPGSNPPPDIFKPPPYYPTTTTPTPTPYKSFFTSPIESIKGVKNNLVNGVVSLSLGIYRGIVHFTENYLP